MIKPKLTVISITIATIVFLFGAALAMGSTGARGSDVSPVRNYELCAQSKNQIQVKTFTGTIGKVGKKLVLSKP